MKIFIATLLLTSTIFLVYGQETEVRFELSSSSERVFLGEKVLLTLRIFDPDLMHLAINDKLKISGVEFQSIINPSALSYTVQLEPVDTGLIKIGPFKIEYQNQILTSNEIFVKVKERLNDNYLIFDVPSTIQCESEGYIKVRSNKIDVSNLELKNSKFFTIIGRTTYTTTNTANNESETVYIKTFKVKFIKRGILELTKEELINVPNNYEIDSVKITIN